MVIATWLLSHREVFYLTLYPNILIADQIYVSKLTGKLVSREYFNIIISLSCGLINVVLEF